MNLPLPFDQFRTQIKQEFVQGSAIAPSLFDAALELVSDTEPLPGGEIRYPIHEALNWGTPTRFGLQARETLHAAIFRNEDGTPWQAKLSRAFEVGQKPYLAPTGNGSRAFLPAISPEYRQLIQQRADLQLTLLEEPAGSFWSWYESHPEIPLVLTEGGKKGLSLLSLGHVTIAVYGCDAGATKDESGAYQLTPDLLRFCQPGRQIKIAFDKDTKFKTIRRVNRAISRLGHLLTEQGVSVRVVEWNRFHGKGIDDLHKNQGSIAVNQAIANAIPFQSWLKQGGKGFVRKSTVSDRDRYIQKRLMRFSSYWEYLKKDFTLSQADEVYQGYAPTLAVKTSSILLRGWLGAGKTEATLRSLLPFRNQQIIWITNRNGLLYQSAERARRLGFDVYHYQDDPALYREMLRTDQPGIFTLCPDSLKDYATKNVKWTDAIVVIDEFSGVRREVLKKTQIMPEFERLLSECLTLIAVDAFLSDVGRRVIQKYRPGNVRIYDQQFQKSTKRIIWLETRNQAGDLSLSHDGIAYPILKKWVAEAKRFAIACDSKLLAKAVQDYLETLGYHGILCSSETIEGNQILLPDPDHLLESAQYFVYTPTAQSGLDCQVSFDCGLALYSGVISPIDFLQMLGRCRQCQEWYVSAPRRSLDPTCPVPSLDSNLVKGWSEKLVTTFTEMGAESGIKSAGWGLWQSLTGEIERAFHSEYLKHLLQHFFESVEVAEVHCDRQQWMQDIKRIKEKELRFTLAANLENGRRLLTQQKAPSKDPEVWDVLLAEETEKYPAVWRELRNQFLLGVEVEDVMTLAKLFSSKRLERLKYWVQATGDQSDEDLADLQELVRTRFTSYLSPRWKALQYLSLFQHLDLDRLAAAEGKAIAHQTHFRVTSPMVGDLWNAFQQLPKLQRLFPTVETIEDFWRVLRRCMSFLGYQSAGQTIRIETPGKLYPNGKDRDGKQRYSESASRYFCGWKPMVASGSVFFQQNFTLIVDTIRDRLNWERQNKQRDREKSLDPPISAGYLQETAA